MLAISTIAQRGTPPPQRRTTPRLAARRLPACRRHGLMQRNSEQYLGITFDQNSVKPARFTRDSA